MFLPMRNAYSPVGIDAGARTVSAVQLIRTRAGNRIHAAASIPRANPAEDLSPGEFMRILAALRRQGFVGDRAVSCVPLAKTFSGVLELPTRTPGAAALPLDSIARQELARTCKLDPATIELAWWELPSGSGAQSGGRSGSSALAIGCAHADATSLLDCLEGGATPQARPHSLDILALDTTPTALARACAPLLSAPPGLTAILSLTHDAAQILILRGPIVVYERTLPEAGLRLLLSGITNQIGGSGPDAAAGADLAEHILRTYGCTPPDAAAQDADALAASAPDACALVAAHADALASELTASMTYAARRFDSSLATVILVGPGAAVPGLAERLGERAGLQPIVPAATDLCPAASSLSAATLGPGLVLALGLALYDPAMEGGPA